MIEVFDVASNSEIEMRWVDTWNKLHDIIGQRHDVPCQLPDWTIVDVEECKGWLQSSVYGGYAVDVDNGWVGHRKGVIASRIKAKS